MTQHKGLRLLDAALTYIEYHPNEWDQKTYRCGTGMCLAGHIAVTIAGGELKRPQDRTNDILRRTQGEAWSYGEGTSIAARARNLLGDAYIPGMFDAFNSLSDLHYYREVAAKQLGEN